MSISGSGRLSGVADLGEIFYCCEIVWWLILISKDCVDRHRVEFVRLSRMIARPTVEVVILFQRPFCGAV